MVDIIETIYALGFLVPLILMIVLPFGVSFYGWSKIREHRGSREASCFLAVCLLVFVVEIGRLASADQEWSFDEDIVLTQFVIGFYLAIITLIWTAIASRGTK